MGIFYFIGVFGDFLYSPSNKKEKKKVQLKSCFPGNFQFRFIWIVSPEIFDALIRDFHHLTYSQTIFYWIFDSKIGLGLWNFSTEYLPEELS